MTRTPSIRDHLERDAWRSHPDFAHRFARRRPHRPAEPPRWPDRLLLSLGCLLLAWLLLALQPARADGEAAVNWGIEVPAAVDGIRPAARTVALDTEIRGEVTGLTARIEVSQRFRNDGEAWAEAIYRFPLPPGAAVDRLRIEAGGRLIEGEIQERTEARRQYQAARDDGRLATLVEQQRPNQFETRLANIGPGEEIRVEIAFMARVDYRDGTFSLSLPLTFTPRWDPPPTDLRLAAASAGMPMGGAEIAHPYGAAVSPVFATVRDASHFLSMELLLHAPDGLALLESRHHDIDVQPTPGGYRVRLADPDTRTDRSLRLEWQPDFGPAPTASLLTWEGFDAVYALLMLTPPRSEAVGDRDREVVFVIDTSGSMEGASIRQARAALEAGLARLGPGDRFNLVRFASETEALYPRSQPVEPARLDEARRFIRKLRADGGTVMAPAFELAMGLPEQPGLLRQVVFVTDGSVGNEAELLLQIGEQLGDTRLFTVSIGSSPNTWFMRKAAEIGRGSHSHIGRQQDVAERMNALWRRIETPAIEDICIDWGMDAEYYPQIIPDLYAGEPLWLTARLPLLPYDVSLCGELDGTPWELAASLSPTRGSEDLARLWARDKLEALEDARMFGLDPGRVRAESLAVALEYGLLSPWTSLVAVDRTPARPRDAALEEADVPSLLPAGSALQAGFTQTATGWPLRLALSALSLLIVTAMLLFASPSRAASGGGARSPATRSSQ